MKKKLLGLLALSLLTTLGGCKEEKRLVLNEKYSEYYDVENEKATKGIVFEYGEVPSLELDEYLLTEQELLEGTKVTLHEMKEELLVEEPIELQNNLDVGDYYLVITDGNEKIQLLVSVRDTVVPEFVDFKDNLKYEEGKEVDLAKLFKAKDLSNTEVKVEGEVDFNKPGKYTIKVVATDESGNITEKECVVEITEKPKEVEKKPTTTTQTQKPSNNTGSTSTKPNNSKPSDGGNTGNSSGGTTNNETVEQEKPKEEPKEEAYLVSKYNQDVFNRINAKRAEAGLPALIYDSNLQWLANVRAEEVSTDWSHNGLKKYEQSEGMDFGEILAYGYTSPEGAMNGWMASQGHKNAILADYFSYATPACYYSSVNGYFWVVVFH